MAANVNVQLQAPQPLPQWRVRANSLNLDVQQSELYELLCNFHSFSHDQYVCLMNQGGYDTLRSMYNWRHKDIYKWCVSMSSLNVNRGGRTFQQNRVRQLQGIAWYVTDCIRRSKQVDVDEYKGNPDEYKDCAEVDYLEGKQDGVSVSKPEKFEYKNWIEWEESVYTYFESVSNSNNIPLMYVIQKDLNGVAPSGRKEEIIYHASRNGYLFSQDNKRVGDIIRELCLGTEAEAWLNNHKGGMECMDALRLHYDGPDEAERRMTGAKAKLERLFYKAEATFPFEKFVTNLIEIFNICERYGMPVYESDKLKYLFDKSQNNHHDFRQEVNIARSTCTSFTDGVTYLKTVVARLFPEGQRMGKKRNINNVKSGKGERGKVKNSYNGIDTSDLTRWYSDEEMVKLPKWLRKKICSDPSHRKKHKSKIDDRVSQRSVKSVVTDATDMSESERRIVAATINGLAKVQRNSPQSSVVTGTGSAIAGRGAIIAATRAAHAAGSQTRQSLPDEISQVTYDHLGNEI